MARENKRTRNERRYGRASLLADRVSVDQWRMPAWSKGLDEESAKAAIRLRNDLLEVIPQTTVVVADNVCEFFYAENPKEFWTIADFPCCAPPRERLFIEMKRPSRVFSEGKVFSAAGLPDRFGLLVRYTPREEIIKADGSTDRYYHREQLKKAIEKMYMKHPMDLNAITEAKKEGLDGIRKLPMAEQQFLMMGIQYLAMQENIKYDDMLPKEMAWSMDVDVMACQNQWITWIGIATYLIASNGSILHRPVLRTLFGPDVPDELARAAVRTVEQACDPGLLALSFMHCKNVTLETVEPDRKTNSERTHAGLKPFVRYHTINIEPMKKVLRTEGKSQETGLQKALHICRGHFSTYSEEKPLFGKVAGTFWIPSHVRGSIKEGVVSSDYKIQRVSS